MGFGASSGCRLPGGPVEFVKRERWAAELASVEASDGLAVTASVRHQDTPYDGLLMSGIDRSEARERVRDTVNSILDAWRNS